MNWANTNKHKRSCRRKLAIAAKDIVCTHVLSAAATVVQWQCARSTIGQQLLDIRRRQQSARVQEYSKPSDTHLIIFIVKQLKADN